ncbi:DUF6668 family protein [Streptomyces flavalbus]|uniref:DUF6668 family protein n=1 Tax=Streptomyces flavalbus TaxID=2665155 RepID=A0ABW2W840_9ACTN
MGVPSATSAGSQMWVRGPTAPQAAPAQAAPPQAAPPQTGRVAPVGLGLPGAAAVPVAGRAAQVAGGDRVAWVSAHGGAGASTLAQALGGADLGRRWPDPASGEPGQVLLVARTHHAGMRAASQALNALRKGEHPAGVELVAVVLVADAPGRLPRPLGRQVRVLRSAATVHRVPWMPRWRLGERTEQLPRPVRALARVVAAPAGRARRPK